MEPLFYAFFFLLVLLIAVLFMIKRDTSVEKVVIERPAFPAGYLFENQFEMITPSYTKLYKDKANPKVIQRDASGNLIPNRR
jgi:hypothetical protein